MTAYIIRRLLFMVPTLLGIMLVSFVVVQFAPGGPVERVIAQLSGADTGATSRISGSPGGDLGARGQPGGAGAIIIGYAIPGFLFAILLIILFAGGSFFNIFPLRGLTSDYWSQLSIPGKMLDYFWHLVLPIVSMGLSAFATMTLLTKNSFLDEVRKQYVLTARAKGCAERQVLYGHVFRNAMLIVIAGFPGAFVHAFFAGSLLIETIFSLDGVGLLGFESVLNRDYAVVFATLYIMSLVGLVVNLLSDLTYTWVDPRIDFETREV